MHIAAVVLSLVLALATLGSGVMKLIRNPKIVASMEAVHVTPAQMTVLGLLEVAAAAGLVVGLWWVPLAIAAAIGSVVYFAGAVVAHLRAHDRELQGAVVLLVVSVATLVVLLLAR
ncbi:DoxX-like family protein [Curtobacterium sp. UNCCL20]|uniref:DoxX family protein n=1 Tax=Curtobacterium sp. UNCCL20 TaxID=1502773 RepID=UPI0008886DAE|nr:DoxX family protein [Curtobacterium sp. UNCCL20]SDQ63976.1 DoxX-like family protein [Curtobacterium sp. UNCCL20]